ncbi:MAG: hypothetical protein V3V95_05895, partial [Thermodesulfobacteriota bacterium]
IEADGGFFNVFKNSNDTMDWSDALGGHAVMLYFFGAHENAEVIFKSVAEHGPMGSAYLLARAENYMLLGLHQEARVAFQELLIRLKNSTRHDLLAYMYLRLGDIANMRKETDDAKAFYESIAPLPDLDTEITFNEPYIMQAMAVGEYYMKAGKDAEAIGVFRTVSGGPFPIGLDLRETVALNLVLLYERDSLEVEAFVAAKDFILLYPDNPYIAEVWRIINDHIHKLIADGYAKHDFNNVLYYYFENIGFIKERRTLLLAGEVLMDIGFPQEANDLFVKLWEANSSYTDIAVLSGLARSAFMLDNRGDAAKLLKRAKASGSKQKLKIAQTWRLLGDEYYRKGEVKGAISAYGEARKSISDEALDLKYATLLTHTFQAARALGIYKGLLKRPVSDALKDEVYLVFAECYVSLKEWRRALTNFHFALKSAKKLKEGEIYYKIGEVNFAMGRDTQALAAWKKAVETDEQGYYKKLARVRIREVEVWKSTRM